MPKYINFLIFITHNYLGIAVVPYGGSYSIFGLNLVVVDEGNKVQDHLNSDLESCKDFCSKNIACKSFAYCSGHNNCHLKNKALDGTETTKKIMTCTTYFKPHYSIFGLNLVVVDEGNKVQDHLNSDLESCKDFCSKNIACKSFAYCSGHNNCHLKNKALDGTETTKKIMTCTTYFKPQGKFF